MGVLDDLDTDIAQQYASHYTTSDENNEEAYHAQDRPSFRTITDRMATSKNRALEALNKALWATNRRYDDLVPRRNAAGAQPVTQPHHTSATHLNLPTTLASLRASLAILPRPSLNSHP